MGPRNQTKIPGLSSLWASCYTDHIPAETEREREREGGRGEREGESRESWRNML